MRKQLTFEFKNEFCEKWLSTLSKAQKETIILVLKEMMVAYFEMKRQITSPGENKGNF